MTSLETALFLLKTRKRKKGVRGESGKAWLAKKLDMSIPTLNSRLKTGAFQELEAKELRYIYSAWRECQAALN